MCESEPPETSRLAMSCPQETLRPSQLPQKPRLAELAAALAELDKSCFEKPWSEAQMLGFCQPENRVTRQTYIWLLDERDLFFYTGETAPAIKEFLPPDKIMAYALWERVLDDAELQRLAVVPAARRRGFGTHLLNAAFDYFCALDCRRCLLEVAADNAAARMLYQERGFTIVGCRRDYYGRGRDALLMDKVLRDASPAAREAQDDACSLP